MLFKAIDKRSKFRSGLFKFRDIESYGNTGILISRKSKSIYFGDTIGWTLKALKDALNKVEALESWQDEILLTMVIGKANSTYRKSILMKSRGEQIYGHWLVDYIPRLHLTVLANLPNDMPIILNNPPIWATNFIEKILGSSHSMINEKNKHILIEECYIPCYTKIGHTFLDKITYSAWSSVRDLFEISNNSINAKLDNDNLPKKIFISRSGILTSKQRKIDNIEGIQKIAEQNGYLTIHPEELSLSEQANLFNHARFVIGEDGSALHSIIFSKKKTRLIVLATPNRINLWHGGICEILGHQIIYIEAENINGKTLIDGEIFAKALKEFEESR